MKLYISILDLTTIYNYNNPFINIWTNQKRLIYKLNKSDGGTVFRFNLIPNTPLGVVFGVYGYTNTNKIHSIGQCVLDGSKMKPKIENSFVINIMDSTTNIFTTGVIARIYKMVARKNTTTHTYQRCQFTLLTQCCRI